MTRAEVLSKLRMLKPWLATRGVVRVRLFGSHARDAAQPDSDVDLLADFDAQPTLLDLIALEQELARELGVPVDLATSSGLKARARARIEAEALDA